MKRYKAKRDGLIHYTLGGVLLLTIGLIVGIGFAPLRQQFPALLLVLSPLGLLLWLYVDTYYGIDQSRLSYRCAFLRGSIDIHHIQSVRVGETMWAGVKPALGTGGLIVRYHRFDEIYLAPDNNDELITDLLAINPTIAIIHKPDTTQRINQVNQP